jgi:hypothetical protein
MIFLYFRTFGIPAMAKEQMGFLETGNLQICETKNADRVSFNYLI